MPPNALPEIDDTSGEGAPVEPPPPHGVTLEDHARIAAELAEKDAPPEKVLAAHELTDDKWNEATVHWMDRMAKDVTRNGIEASVPIVYSDAFSRAQDALKPLSPMTADEWATLTVEVQRAGGPARPLAVRKLSISDYLRLARHWARTLSTDPAQNEVFFATYQALQPKAR